MAQYQDDAAGGAGDDLDSAAAAISGLNLDEFSDTEQEDPKEHENSHPEGEEDELDLDADGDDDEQEDGDDEQSARNAIDAPASLNAEEKAKFAALTPEAQRYVADLESRRAIQVQTATTKAADAQRAADQRAAQADAQAQARYAQQLKAIGESLAPQMPDPALASYDPATYIAQKAQYDAAKAQHDEFMQQAESLGTDAGQAMSQAEIQQRDSELMAIPEVANEATREEWFKKALGAADVLGLDRSQMDHATAAELKALRQVADWREKSEKYDAATARQMQRVRDGKKARTTKPNAAQPSSAEGRGYRESRERLQKSGDVKDAAAAIARMGL